MLGNSSNSREMVSFRKGKTYKLAGIGAVILTVKKCLPQKRDQAVLVRSERTRVVQYMVKDGGTRSPPLCYKATELWQIAIDNNIQLKSAHIAGWLNILLEQFSRVVIRHT